MFIKAKKIIGNKVMSQSGYFLGRLIDFEVDASSQNIVKYYVSGGLFDFLKDYLIIDHSQVIEIKKDKIIVEDTVIPKKIAKKKISSDVEYVK